jgi:tetratricopeptide (TPR) repeat protein
MLLRRFMGAYNTLIRAMPQPAKPRRQVLEEFLAAHPNDAFARYGLAMECSNRGDHGAALEHFRQLLEAHPNYVVGYFQYGQLLARLARNDDARRILTAGIETAQRTGDEHARSEMEAVLAGLG